MCPEGFSLKTLKLQSIMHGTGGFWSWLTTRERWAWGEEGGGGQHSCLGSKVSFLSQFWQPLCLAHMWQQRHDEARCFLCNFSYHSYSYNQMFGEKANKLSLYVCMRIYTNRCRRAYMHVSWRFLSALSARGLGHDNADVTEAHDTTRVCRLLLLRWNPLSTPTQRTPHTWISTLSSPAHGDVCL